MTSLLGKGDFEIQTVALGKDTAIVLVKQL